MSSVLYIKITTDGDYKQDKPLFFYPRMIDPKYINSTIYFPPTIKLSKGLFNYVSPKQDIIDILTLPKLFTEFIKNVVKSDYTTFKKISLQEAYDKGIIKNNLDFFKDLFFSKRKIYFNGVAFSIRKSYILNNSIISPLKLPQTQNTPLIYQMTVHLSLIKTSRATRMNLMRENCKDKAKRIDELSSLLFGKNFGLTKKDLSSQVGFPLPAMYSSPSTGYTTEMIPKKQPYRYPYPQQPYRYPYPQQPYQLPYPSNLISDRRVAPAGKGLQRGVSPHSPGVIGDFVPYPSNSVVGGLNPNPYDAGEGERARRKSSSSLYTRGGKYKKNNNKTRKIRS